MLRQAVSRVLKPDAAVRRNIDRRSPRVLRRAIFTRDPKNIPSATLSNRVFGKVEKFLGAHNFYYGGCFHLVRVMQFTKRIDPEILVDALDDLHVRHPMLSQEIIRAPIVGGAFKSTDSDIPLITVSEPATEAVLARLVDAELNTAIPGGLALRVTLVQSDDLTTPSAFILTLNHAGADAASSASLSYELLERYLLLEEYEAQEKIIREKGTQESLSEPEIEILPDVGGIESFLPTSHRFFGGFASAGSIYRKETAKTDKYPVTLELVIPPIPSGASGKLSGLHCRNILVQTPSAPILESCKKHGTTVTATITAALLVSMKKNIFDRIPEEPNHYVYQTGVDLRKQFEPPIESKYLMPMAGVTHNIVKVSGEDIWSLAKTIEETDKKSLDANEPFNLSNYLLATNSSFGDSVSRRPGPVLTVSNYGLATPPKDLVESFGIAAMCDFKTNKLPQLQVVTSSFEQTMNIAVTYPQTPALEDDDVEDTISNALTLIVDEETK